jgi:hypothetical protein
MMRTGRARRETRRGPRGEYWPAAARWLVIAGLAVFAAAGRGCESTGGPGGGARWGAAQQGGEQWTIRCVESTAPQRRRVIEAYAEGLKRVGGIDPGRVRVSHEPTRSVLFYGTYQKVYNAEKRTMQFSEAMTRDIKLIRSLTMNGQYPFLLAEPEPLEHKEPGPPEWDLTKAPGAYALQIAVFYNEGKFQQRELAAVQYCQALREEGVEAWYHHGTHGRSIVCVGHFPASAVIEQPDGTREYSPDVARLQASHEDFGYNLINGRIVKRRQGDGELKPIPSFLVRIPKEGAPEDEWTLE